MIGDDQRVEMLEAGWETELVLLDHRQTRVWRKPMAKRGEQQPSSQ